MDMSMDMPMDRLPLYIYTHPAETSLLFLCFEKPEHDNYECRTYNKENGYNSIVEVDDIDSVLNELDEKGWVKEIINCNINNNKIIELK